MAVNYAPLIAQWTTLTGSPTVTTVAEAQNIPTNLAQINALTVTGSIPTLTNITGDAIFNCLVWSEFNPLLAAEKTQLMQICTIPGQILGGSSSPFIAPFFSTLASRMPTTINNLIALSKAVVTPWWQANGYLGPIVLNDLLAAGIVTSDLAHQAGLI